MLQHHACFSFFLQTAYQEITLQSSFISFKMPLLLPTAELKQPRLIAILLMIYTTVLTVVLFSQGINMALSVNDSYFFLIFEFQFHTNLLIFLLLHRNRKNHLFSPVASGAAILLTIYIQITLYIEYMSKDTCLISLGLNLLVHNFNHLIRSTLVWRHGSKVHEFLPQTIRLCVFFSFYPIFHPTTLPMIRMQ